MFGSRKKGKVCISGREGANKEARMKGKSPRILKEKCPEREGARKMPGRGRGEEIGRKGKGRGNCPEREGAS